MIITRYELLEITLRRELTRVDERDIKEMSRQVTDWEVMERARDLGLTVDRVGYGKFVINERLT